VSGCRTRGAASAAIGELGPVDRTASALHPPLHCNNRHPSGSPGFFVAIPWRADEPCRTCGRKPPPYGCVRSDRIVASAARSDLQRRPCPVIARRHPRSKSAPAPIALTTCERHWRRPMALTPTRQPRPGAYTTRTDTYNMHQTSHLPQRERSPTLRPTAPRTHPSPPRTGTTPLSKLAWPYSLQRGADSTQAGVLRQVGSGVHLVREQVSRCIGEGVLDLSTRTGAGNSRRHMSVMLTSSGSTRVQADPCAALGPDVRIADR
jgi:hypothetical protein